MLLRSKNIGLAVLVCAAAFAPVLSAGHEAPPRPATILITGPTALDVSVAVYDAVRRLREPRCQEVLDDFTDAEGRPLPLRESLGTSTPEAYLKRLVIRDGEVPSGHCASRDTAAFTTSGATVFVCGTTFRTLPPGARANALIHEMLHTLGLRENPPTSTEISRRVQARCGY